MVQMSSLGCTSACLLQKIISKVNICSGFLGQFCFVLVLIWDFIALPLYTLKTRSHPRKWSKLNFITSIFWATCSTRLLCWTQHRCPTDSFSLTWTGPTVTSLVWVAGCSWVHKEPNPTEHTSPDTYHLGFLFSFGTESVNGSTYWFLRSWEFPKYLTAKDQRVLLENPVHFLMGYMIVK